MLCLDEVQVTLMFYEKRHGEAETCYAKICEIAKGLGLTALMGDYEQGLSVGTSEGSSYYWKFEGEKDKMVEFLDKIAELNGKEIHE